MIRIYTSYFGNVKNLPSNIEPIAICGGIPDSWKGKWTRTVAPRLKFFNEWKYVNHDNDYYIEHFNSEVIGLLDPRDFALKLFDLSDGKIPCMICYEKPNEFCHRHLVADWLNNGIKGMNCIEYSSEDKTKETLTEEETGLEIF